MKDYGSISGFFPEEWNIISRRLQKYHGFPHIVHVFRNGLAFLTVSPSSDKTSSAPFRVPLFVLGEKVWSSGECGITVDFVLNARVLTDGGKIIGVDHFSKHSDSTYGILDFVYVVEVL